VTQTGSDADFDDLGDAFEADVYGTTKGRVRLEVLWEDLLDAVPAIAGGSLSVLDAGGGSGHLAVRLARAGNRVLLADPSERMLAMAGQRVEEEGLSEGVTVMQSDVAGLRELSERFDLVCCHAVLEWLAEPRAAIEPLGERLEPEGRLSLMFYNRNAAVLKRVLRGDFDHDIAGGEGPAPLDPEEVAGWLEAAGLRVLSKAGVRIFHDHLPPEVVEAGFDRLLEVEKAYRGREPFASLGQHVHLVCGRSRS
jgi:S-adenosylmethionine-dependent methyltransferase